MSNELVVIEKENVLTVFTKGDQLDEIIKQVEMEVATFEHDLSNDNRRKKTASLARKVASTKTYLDGLGKDLVSEWKANAKVVDQNRKSMRDRLDELRDLARKPLTDWENEQKEIEEAKRIAEEAEKLLLQIESDHEIGLLLNEKIDREIEEARLAAEKAEQERLAEVERLRVEREEQIKREAAEQAKLEAERLAKEQADKIEREKQQAIDAAAEEKRKAEQAERDRIAAEERARVQAEIAEKNRLAEIERQKQIAIDAENKRLADIEAAKLAEIQRQKDVADKIERDRLAAEANKAHAAKIHRAMMKVATDSGIPQEYAKAFVVLLAKNQIPHIGKIQY